MRKLIALIPALTVLTLTLVFSPTSIAARGEDDVPQLGKTDLLRLLDDESIYKRMFATYNIGGRGLGASDKLRDLAGSDSPWMRRAAIFSLGLKPDEKLLPVFEKALADKNYGVRRAAVIAIGNAKSPSAKRLLRTALEDQDYGVRELALIAVVMNGFKDMTPDITKCLDDSSIRVRRTAAAALGQLGDRNSLAPLRALMAKIEAGEITSPPEKEVKARLRRSGTYPYGFIHFPELIEKFSADSGIELRVNDEVLYGMYIHAQDPNNLDSVKMKFYNTPTDETLSRICKTMGAYYYVESGTVNIAATSYYYFDTDLEFEVAASMYMLGDRSRRKTIESYKNRDIYSNRVKALLK